MYNWTRWQFQLISAGGLLRGAIFKGNYWGAGSCSKIFWAHCQHSSFPHGPGEGFAIPTGLKHWGPWHGHAHVSNTVSQDFFLFPKVVSFLTLIIFPSVHTIFSLVQTDSSVRSLVASAYDGGIFNIHCLDWRHTSFLLCFLPVVLEVQVLPWSS